MYPKTKRRVGERTTEETSGKSEELESKDQGTCTSGRLFAAWEKAMLVINNYWCATNIYSTSIVGVVKEWASNCNNSSVRP